MTKKDKPTSPTSSNPSDFFAGLSEELQFQVEGLSGAAMPPGDAAEGKEEQTSGLFAAPEQEQSTTPEEGEADLFDTAPAGPPATDSSLTDGVPYPAALSDVALESTVGHPHPTLALTDAESPAPDSIDAAQADTDLADAASTASSPEHNANADSHETTNADDTNTMADQPSKDTLEATAAESATAEAAEEEATESATAEAIDAKADEDADLDADAGAKVDADAPDESADVDAAAPSDEASASAETNEAAEDVAAPDEAAEVSEASPADDEEAAAAAEDDAPLATIVDGVLIQQGQRADRESVPLEKKPFRSSAPDTTLAHDDGPFVLVEALEHAPDRVVWLARREGDDDGPEYQVCEVSAARYRSGYQHFPDVPSLNFHKPFTVIEEDERAFLIYEPQEGTLLQTQLRSPEHHWTIGQLRRFMRQLAENVHAVHEAGFLLLEISEQHIWLDEQRLPILCDLERLYNERTPFHLRPIYEGFSAPELYHQQPIGPHTDVFSLGVLLHYMISQCPAFNHLDLPNPQIPSPRIYQLDFPVGLDHVIEIATHLDANRRYADIPAFMQALERAFHEIEDRHRQEHTPLQLSVGHDIHIGINKGMRNPVNQDALFWRYDRRRHKGLFLVADGVSHCHYGSGDRASSILIQAARQTWDALMDNPMMDGPTDHKQRRQILNTIFEAANKAIAGEVNKLYDQVEGYVEDVMGSTCVGGFLDGNQITVTNLGDSRAYLKTEHYIEQINVDHDYKTAQLQIGQDVRSLQSLMGGSLITRCVGSCRKDDDLKVVPLQLQADFFDLTLIPGDIILFCSDGLTDYAGETEEEAREMMSKIVDVHTEPRSACFWLVALANQRGGGDNISVIELKVLDTL